MALIEIVKSKEELVSQASEEARPQDIVSAMCQTPEQEARVRPIFEQVGPNIFQLLAIARNEYFQRLSTMNHRGSVEARKCTQFIFAADVSLGFVEAPSNE